MVVVWSIEVDEVREESTCRHLAGELVEVVVAVLREVAHTSLLLPDLDREDCGRAVSDTLISGVKNLADDASSLCGGVGTVVDGAEYHLVSTTRMY